MSKQDRQGVRTAADLERKYKLSNIDKAYTEASRLPAYISVAMDSLSASLRNELTQQIEALTKETADNLAEAVKGYVKTEDFDAFKTTIQTILQGFELALLDCVKTDEYELYKQSISTELQGIKDYLMPYEEWIPLTVDSAFTVRNNDDSLKPVCKITGNVVTVCGAVSNVAEMTSTSSGAVFASGIPEAYRPHMDQHFICQGSGMNRWQCSVKTDGTLMVSRYGITEQGTMGANTWLPFSCTYQI